MPSVTIYADKEHSVTNAPGNYGNSKDDHAPVGLNTSTGWRYRDLLWFPLSQIPVGAKLVSATLKMKTTSGVHMQHGSNPTVRIRRLTESFAASGGSGETWQTSANPAGFTTASTSSDEEVWGPAGADQTVYSKSIIDIVEDQAPTNRFRRSGAACGGDNVGIELRADDESNGNHRIEFMSMRGGYVPRLVVEYTTEPIPDAPTLDTPIGSVASQPTNYIFDFPVDNVIGSYDLDIGSTAGASDLWTGDNLTLGLSGTHVDRVMSPTMPVGSTVYWRARGHSDGGTGPWGSGTFIIPAVPTVTLDAPVPSGRAHIWNLGDLAVWTNGGAHAKPRLTITYTHPTGMSAQAIEVEIDGNLEAFSSSAPSGTQFTLNCARALVRNTDATFRVRMQAADGTWSAWTSLVTARVNWAQGVYPFAPASGASSFGVDHAALANGGQVAYAYRNTASGGWQSSIGAVTPGTSMEMLVRISTTSTTTTPTLASAKVNWSTDPEPTPDHWLGFNCDISLDATQRRFGVHSLRVTPTGTAWEVFNPAPVAVTPGARYTFSAYVNTLGDIGSDRVRLYLYGEDGATIPTWGVLDPATAETSDSSGYPDGWQRLYGSFVVEEGVTVWPVVAGNGASTPGPVRIDSVQFEEGPVASGWQPGTLGPAVVLDVGGIAVDAQAGGIFRLRSANGDIIQLEEDGLTHNGQPIYPVPGPVVNVYTSDDTWTVPAGLHHVVVDVVGGGGGGGGAASTTSGNASGGGGGGGAGACRKTFLAADLSETSYGIVVGAGASGGAAGQNNGGVGEDSTFGAGTTELMTGGGGGAGVAMASGNQNNSNSGGGGGSASGGDLNWPGGGGGPISRVSTTVPSAPPTNYGGPAGGPYGGASINPAGASGAGSDGRAYGGGGGGARNGQSQSAAAGGDGADGVVVVTEYYA